MGRVGVVQGGLFYCICYDQLSILRCNSIERSLRVALFNSSLLIDDLYTGRSPMCIQIVYWLGLGHCHGAPVGHSHVRRVLAALG